MGLKIELFSRVSKNKLLDVFTDNVKIVNASSFISGSLLYRVYIQNSLIEEFCSNVIGENIYFSDHDGIGILIDKNVIPFHTILWYSIWSDNKEEFGNTQLDANTNKLLNIFTDNVRIVNASTLILDHHYIESISRILW